MTNILVSQSPLERLMALDPGQEVGIGAALITVEYSAPGCPEGRYIVRTDAVEDAWFTSPEERMDQAEALVSELEA